MRGEGPASVGLLDGDWAVAVGSCLPCSVDEKQNEKLKHEEKNEYFGKYNGIKKIKNQGRRRAPTRFNSNS